MDRYDACSGQVFWLAFVLLRRLPVREAQWHGCGVVRLTAAGAAPEWPQCGVTGFPFHPEAQSAPRGTRNVVEYTRDPGATPPTATPAGAVPPDVETRPDRPVRG